MAWVLHRHACLVGGYLRRHLFGDATRISSGFTAIVVFGNQPVSDGYLVTEVRNSRVDE
jgi:hypothetical protein